MLRWWIRLMGKTFPQLLLRFPLDKFYLLTNFFLKLKSKNISTQDLSNNYSRIFSYWVSIELTCFNLCFFGIVDIVFNVLLTSMRKPKRSGYVNLGQRFKIRPRQINSLAKHRPLTRRIEPCIIFNAFACNLLFFKTRVDSKLILEKFLLKLNFFPCPFKHTNFKTFKIHKQLLSVVSRCKLLRTNLLGFIWWLYTLTVFPVE